MKVIASITFIRISTGFNDHTKCIHSFCGYNRNWPEAQDAGINVVNGIERIIFMPRYPLAINFKKHINSWSSEKRFALRCIDASQQDFCITRVIIIDSFMQLDDRKLIDEACNIAICMDIFYPSPREFYRRDRIIHGTTCKRNICRITQRGRRGRGTAEGIGFDTKWSLRPDRISKARIISPSCPLYLTFPSLMQLQPKSLVVTEIFIKHGYAENSAHTKREKESRTGNLWENSLRVLSDMREIRGLSRHALALIRPVTQPQSDLGCDLASSGSPDSS